MAMSLSSSTTLVGIFVCLLGLVSISMVSSASCASCEIHHPQQKFCKADFVFKVRPKSRQYVDINGKPVLYSNRAYDVQYKVKVESVFKGKDLLPEGQRTIFIYSPKDICNIDRLETGIRYLISGTLRGDKMEVITCGIVERWSDLTPSQRRGVRGFYESQCSSCKIRGSSIVHPHGGNEIFNEMSSGLWSKQECFFNPMASITYGSDDCETKHSYCIRQKDGSCAWEGETAYEDCFREREFKWQLMQFQELGQFAWTCPEQCKGLTPKKLKYKCKKATRKMAPCESGDTVREFEPNTGREMVRTVDPSSVQEIMRTVNPSVARDVEGGVESPEIIAALSPMLADDQ